MGENSQPNPESDVIFKKVSVWVSKNLVLKKVSVSFSKKSQYWSQKYLVSKKVLLLVSNEISGLVTQWCKGILIYQLGRSYLTSRKNGVLLKTKNCVF